VKLSGGRAPPPASKNLANWAPTESDRQFVVDPLRQEFLRVLTAPQGPLFPGAVPEKAWFPGPPKSSDPVRVFLRSPRGSTGAASFKSNLPAQPDFFGNSPRPPSDLADKLMRNSSSGQNSSLDRKAAIPIPGRGFQGAAAPCMANLFFSRRKPLRP
jgi:hypothetical protein